MNKGASPSGDRATHERSRVTPSPPTVGIPSAVERRESRMYRLRLEDEEWRGRERDAELSRGPYAGD